MRFFQSIFGRETRGRYPESLIEQAIERAVDGTDSRLRLIPGYRKQLRAPVLAAIDHVVALVDAIPSPVPASRAGYSADARLAAVFSSPSEMLDVFARDTALQEYLSTPDGRRAEQVIALMRAERSERNILGLELIGDQVRRDQPQVTVSFGGYRLLDPTASEDECRRHWKRRAFDHLLAIALARIAELSIERADLKRQRDLLQQKRRAFECGGCSFSEVQDSHRQGAAAQAELTRLGAQLEALGADHQLLHRHLELVAGLLADAPRQLWSESVRLHLDAMNIRRAGDDVSARTVELDEMHNAQGLSAAVLAVALRPADLPVLEDPLIAAQRSLQ